MPTTISPSPLQSKSDAARPMDIAQSVYQADHQVKLLSLHADAESLLQQLQVLKQQRAELN
jgi:hypothetical protein